MFYIIWRVAGSAHLSAAVGCQALASKTVSLSLSPQLRISLLLHSQLCSRMLLLKRHPIHWTKFAFFRFFSGKNSSAFEARKVKRGCFAGIFLLSSTLLCVSDHCPLSLESPESSCLFFPLRMYSGHARRLAGVRLCPRAWHSVTLRDSSGVTHKENWKGG